MMNYVRRGTGKPLLLIHGIGSSHHAWDLILDNLADQRDVIALDLPGFGQTPPLVGETSIRTLADAVTAFLTHHDLLGIDAVGSSMGARLVLELVRRGGVLGAVVSLDPGGFWQGWEIPFFYHSVRLSAHLVEFLQPALPFLTRNPLGRTLLLAQFSASPWKIPASVALTELQSFKPTSTFTELLDNLAHGEAQRGAAAGSLGSTLVIGWGRQDRVCLPSQSEAALRLFPDAQLHWFKDCGHFPQLDQPYETTQLILAVSAGTYQPRLVVAPAASPSATRLIGVGAAVLLAVGLWVALRPVARH